MPGDPEPATLRFYASGKGSRLVEPVNYPAAIQRYLAEEAELLARFAGGFSMLIEIGCMEGRYARWALARGKRYLGIDPVEEYVAAGRKALGLARLPGAECRLLEGCAESVDRILAGEQILGRERVLLFFPFNSFGQIREPAPVVEALARCASPILIGTYATDAAATQARAAYYGNCGFAGLTSSTDAAGVRFRSDDGLESVAYHPDYLAALFARAGIEIACERFAEIGMACHTAA